MLPEAMPHDALFKALMADRERAAKFIALSLPAALASRMALGAFATRMPGTFVNERGGQTHCDAVFELELAEESPRRTVLLLEHKSWVDGDTPVKLLGYIADILGPDFNRRWHGHAPCVIPMVLYHGRRRWTVTDRIGGKVDAEAGTGPGLDMEYILIDLHRDLERYSPDGEIHAVMTAMHVAGQDKGISARDLDRVVARLKPGSRLEVLTVDYLIELTDLDMDRLKASLQRMRKEKGQEDMDTLLKKMKRQARQEGIEKGIEKGIEQGIERGIRQGIERGKAGSLIRLLNLRFENVPGSAFERVQGATVAELDEWTAAVLTASSVDEVLEAEPRH